MFVTPHARDRLADRLADVDADAIVARLKRARGERARVARVVARLVGVECWLPGTYPPAESNGDLVIAICEDRKVITIMYRRSGQPLTAASLRVTRVLDVDGAVLERVA